MEHIAPAIHTPRRPQSVFLLALQTDNDQELLEGLFDLLLAVDDGAHAARLLLVDRIEDDIGGFFRLLEVVAADGRLQPGDLLLQGGPLTLEGPDVRGVGGDLRLGGLELLFQVGHPVGRPVALSTRGGELRGRSILLDSDAIGPGLVEAPREEEFNFLRDFWVIHDDLECLLAGSELRGQGGRRRECRCRCGCGAGRYRDGTEITRLEPLVHLLKDGGLLLLVQPIEASGKLVARLLELGGGLLVESAGIEHFDDPFFERGELKIE